MRTKRHSILFHFLLSSTKEINLTVKEEILRCSKLKLLHPESGRDRTVSLLIVVDQL